MTTTSSWASGCLSTTGVVTTTPNPECYITVGKQRRKHFDGIVYLPGETEFEIELYNPLSEDILANIKIDGKYLSGGLILHPGQRVFLERSWDDPASKKFKFYTYVVDPSNGDVMRAIESNGSIEVTFHKKKSTFYSPTFTYTTTPFTYTSSPTVKGIGVHGIAYFSSTAPSLETGRVGKGSDSSQKFMEVNEEFETFGFYNFAWRIRPESVRPKTVEDLKKYCTECGARIRKATFKYCPHCGNKIE